MTAQASHNLTINDVGRLAYAPALDLQRQTHRRVLAGEASPTLILVEHDPVITVSRRRSSSDHLLFSPRMLGEKGIDVQPTDRGGDVTYHGPGQLVAYPILRLGELGLSISRYMRFLEQTVIDTVAAFGIAGQRDERNTGVWAAARETEPGQPADPGGLPRKLCAIGVRLSRGVTLHGLALNVTTDLSHFQTIVPCGLHDRGVTSLQQLLGDRTPSMNDVKNELAGTMQRRWRQAREEHLCTRA